MNFGVKKIIHKVIIVLVLVTILPMTVKAAIRIDKKSLTLSQDQTYTLKLKGTKKKAKWSTSNKKVAAVSKKGKVKGIKKGTCKITAKIGKKKYVCNVTVTQPVTKITLNKKTLKIAQGDTGKLKATVLPANANNRKVTWSSKNSSIATVSQDGVIKAVNIGTTNVSATAKDGSKKTASCTVTVVGKSILADFTADDIHFQTDSNENILFTVKGENITENIYLYNQNNVSVAEMNDDGQNGDAEKGDGIYSCKYNANKTEAGKYSFYAKTGTIKSETIILYFYEKATESDKEKTQMIINDVQEISSKYLSDDAIITESQAKKACDEVVEYAKKLISDGEALYYNVTEQNILIKMKSGINMLYFPPIEGIDAVGSNEAMSISTMQPFKSNHTDTSKKSLAERFYYRTSVLPEFGNPDKAASSIAKEFTNYSFNENLDDSDVTLEKIKNIGSNQVVLWHGHGRFNINPPTSSLRSLHSLLYTIDKFDADKYPQYDISHGLVNCDIETGNTYISAEFIKKYCKNMKNSFIYLGACYSGTDSVLADAFLNKGAAAVIGNSSSIDSAYNLKMMKTTVEKMTEINPSTNNYYTLYEALNYAKEKHGYDDGKQYHAYPIIFGGVSAHNYRFGDVEVKLDKEEATIPYNGTLMLTATVHGKTPKVTWSSSNTDVAKVDSNGKITAVNSGKAIITAAVLGNKATCDVIVGSLFDGGDGSVTNPYQISKKEHLESLYLFPDCHFIQTKDIDYENGAIRKTLFGSFSGTYDGQDHYIKNINVACDSLWGNISKEGCIKNVHVSNIYVRDYGPSGFVKVNNGNITHCSVTDLRIENVNGSAYYASGICYENNGTISQCALYDSTLPAGGWGSSSMTVSQYKGSAGLAGVNNSNGLIEYCNVVNITYNTGNHAALAFVNSGVIDHCNVKGIKPLEDSYPGFVAILVYNNTNKAVISNCSYSDVTGDMKILGGNAGMMY